METVTSSALFCFESQQIGQFWGLRVRLGCMQDIDVFSYLIL